MIKTVKILIVEDEKPISELLRMSLTDAGYVCECVYDGARAADMTESVKYDLILLDIMLPEIDGYDLMEYIRPTGVPVIFITARDTVRERVKGLKLGADDYIVKPFEIIELLARVETVLRRFNKHEKMVEIGDVSIDIDSRTVKKSGRRVELTVKEFSLLLFFIKNKNIALYRDVLYEKVWENDYMGETRTVDLHVQRLRRKLGWDDRIIAVQKVGYRLEV